MEVTIFDSRVQFQIICCKCIGEHVSVAGPSSPDPLIALYFEFFHSDQTPSTVRRFSIYHLWALNRLNDAAKDDISPFLFITEYVKSKFFFSDLFNDVLGDSMLGLSALPGAAYFILCPAKSVEF